LPHPHRFHVTVVATVVGVVKKAAATFHLFAVHEHIPAFEAGLSFWLGQKGASMYMFTVLKKEATKIKIGFIFCQIKSCKCVVLLLEDI
jgi:hypothetical protein